jgi:D-serine deaminase-like pyridoxal phosphate-dependent protein
MPSPPPPVLPVPLEATAELPVALADADLDTPALLVDLDVVETNIARMQDLADREGFALRPHVKSHKSLAVAARQLEAGASGLCVATSSEAQVMAAGSSRDILVAYPLLGRRKLQRLDALAGDGRLILVTDSVEVTEGYRAYARDRGVTIRVMVEVDTGMHRAGALPPEVAKVAVDVARGDQLDFVGIMTHAGHAHDAAGHAEITRVARTEAAMMGDVREELESLGLDVRVVSAGSTITAPYLRREDGITEIRPGTYVYNDLRTLGRFACTADMIAASMLSTVVSISGSRVTLDAGSKTLTTSRDAVYGNGSIVELPNATFSRLSEEHGVLAVPDVDETLQVGMRLRILPVHICVWMDLQTEIYGLRAGRVVERIAVEGMRHSL